MYIIEGFQNVATVCFSDNCITSNKYIEVENLPKKNTPEGHFSILKVDVDNNNIWWDHILNEELPPKTLIKNQFTIEYFTKEVLTFKEMVAILGYKTNPLCQESPILMDECSLFVDLLFLSKKVDFSEEAFETLFKSVVLGAGIMTEDRANSIMYYELP